MKQSHEFYVGSKSVIEGAVLEVAGTARIDGRLSGTIKANHLIVGKSGFVTGDISATSAEVEGRLENKINLSGKLSVRSTGCVKGDITYGAIEALEGAKVIGQMEIQSEPSEPAPPSSVSGLAAAIRDRDLAEAEEAPTPESESSKGERRRIPFMR